MLNKENNYENSLFVHDLFRKLWEQHAMWTRSFIASAVQDLPDLRYVTNRLLRNPIDFEKVFKIFYGEEIAGEFKTLLTEHLLIAADLVSAAKQGNMEVAGEIRKTWYKNADEIAEFLGGINPYWNQKRWKELLYDHLEMTEQEAVTMITGEYEKNVNMFDEMEAQVLQMADYMSDGIIKQFKIY